MSEVKKAKESSGRVRELVEVTERRRHDRFEAAFDVRVSMTEPQGSRVDAEAWVRDVSANGLGFCCSEEFAVGDNVTVRAPGRSMQCEVRHIREEGELFAIGVEVLSSSDGTDIQGSLRELSRSLHFSSRTSQE